MAKFSKTDQRYWEDRVYLPKTKGQESSQFAVQIQVRGERHTLSLGTGHKKNAAKKARDIYLLALGDGWEAVMQQFRPDTALKTDLTLGAYVDAVHARGFLRLQTWDEYRRCLFQVAAGIAKIEGQPRERWLEQVRSLPLSILTKPAIEGWKASFLASRPANPVEAARARTRVNTIQRNAKALFSKRIVSRLDGVCLPSPLPFADCLREREGARLYRSSINLEALVEKAEQRWGGSDSFLIFLLALTVGLRRNEIDKLQWFQVDPKEGVIRIEATDCFEPKADSAGEMAIDAEVMALLQSFREQRPHERFVIQGGEPRLGTRQRVYRADFKYRQLVAWLRAEGVTTNQPIHTLRKEFGSAICRKAGIHAASRLLRHSSIGITAQHYLDENRRIVSGIGELLNRNQAAGEDE